MKTKYWIILLAAIMILCLGQSIPLLFSNQDAAYAQIISDGQVIQIVDLRIEQEIPISTNRGGRNIVTVKDSAIGVTEANCPDHYCMDRGMCLGGTQIVCLPNRLVIRFIGSRTVDSITG